MIFFEKIDHFIPVREQERIPVLFCAHPDDTETYLNQLSEEFWNCRYNIDFWYAKESKTTDESKATIPDMVDAEQKFAKNVQQILCKAEEVDAYLRCMKMLVVPVTARYLECPNIAKDVLVPTAQNLMVPIAFVMTDPKLYQAYEKLYQDTQALPLKNEQEEGATFSQKLSKYIEAILAKEEEADRIHSYFQRRIFFSYRKQDRSQLLKAIHILREVGLDPRVAIWYDEALPIGEGYRNSILEELHRSDLFLMLITQKVLEPGNFVMEIEYPEAVKNNKRILTLLAEETNIDALNSAYPELPTPIRMDDLNTLKDALSKELGNEYIHPQQEESPEHQYLLGLAYLKGIEVIQNRPKGIELLKSAASSGSKEACKRLASLYKHGMELGTRISNNESLLWENQYVKYLAQDVRRNLTLSNLLTYTKAAAVLNHEMIRPENGMQYVLIPELGKELDFQKELLEKLSFDASDERVQILLSSSMEVISYIVTLSTRGTFRFSSSYDQYVLSCIDFLLSLYQKTGIKLYGISTCLILYCQVGRCAFKNKEREEWLAKAEDLYNQLCTKFGDTEIQKEIAAQKTTLRNILIPLIHDSILLRECPSLASMLELVSLHQYGGKVKELAEKLPDQPELQNFLTSLTPREQAVLERKFLSGKESIPTDEEIAAELGISKEQVHSILRRIARKMKIGI